MKFKLTSDIVETVNGLKLLELRLQRGDVVTHCSYPYEEFTDASYAWHCLQPMLKSLIDASYNIIIKPLLNDKL